MQEYYGTRAKLYIPAHQFVAPSEWTDAAGISPETRSAQTSRVAVSEFLIDKYPVTRREFVQFILGCSSLAKSMSMTLDLQYWQEFEAEYQYDENAPIVGVTFSEAMLYCNAHGGRLPLLGEWTLASAGMRLRRYPWSQGRTIGGTAHHCNWQPDLRTNGVKALVNALTPVDRFSRGRSPYGLFDCLGNARELSMSPFLGRQPRTVDAVSQTSWQSRLWTSIPEVYVCGSSIVSPILSNFEVGLHKPYSRFSPFGGRALAGSAHRDMTLGFRVAYDVGFTNSYDKQLFRAEFAK